MLQEGLEPPTLGLLDPCSTKLSYQSCAAHARDRTKDLQIFSLTLSQLSYMGVHWRKLWAGHRVRGAAGGGWGAKKVHTMRLPGIEPRSNAWEASMITITLQALKILLAGIEPATPGS